MLASSTWFTTSDIASSSLTSVTSPSEVIASTSKPLAFQEASLATLSIPSTPSSKSSSVGPDIHHVQGTTPLIAYYPDQLTMNDDNKQHANIDCDHQGPPAKRLKITPKKAKSVSPRCSKKRRSSSTVPSRLIAGVTTPDRIRSPGARSRSTTEFGSLEGTIPRSCCTTHDGSFGDELITAETVVKRLIKTYKAYFHNPDDPNDRSFDPHPTNFPFVLLEYPNTNSREVFPLLIPKDEDHYSPIKEVKKSLFTIIETFLTPPQAALFGTPPDQLRPSDFALPRSDLLVFSPSSKQKVKTVSSTPPVSDDLLLTLVHANNSQNGPLFVSTFSKITELLRSIKRGEFDDDGRRINSDASSDYSQIRPVQDPNPMRKAFQSWNGVPPNIWKTIIDETYQRAVGPNIPLLRKYPAWSSEAYGELETEFVSDIVHYTGLKSTSRFFDMGSGVGTVVLQTALQAGCISSGIEKMKHPAAIAEQHMEQFQYRCRMWGVEPGPAELLTGDFTDDDRVRERILDADVVLVNNWAFSEKLNQSLLNHFLDMKEGAIVVSLRSFIPPNFRLTEHTIGSPAAILRVEERPFQAGSVSWMSGGGVYFINTIDRGMVAALHDQLSQGRAPRTRSVKTKQP